VTADYQFTVEGQDSTGGTVVTATERLNVIALDPAKAVNLSVTAVADREEVEYFPGKVYFTVTVTNLSSVEAKNVAVVSTGVKLYEFSSIPAGESRSFKRDVNASMAGQYRFDAQVKNELGELQSFESNIIRISQAQPKVIVTREPIPTPRAPVYEPDPTDDGMPAYMATVQSALGLVHRLALVLAAMGAALLLIGLIRRLIARSRVQDRLERGKTRNYIEESDAVKDEPAPAEEQPVQEQPVQQEYEEETSAEEMPAEEQPEQEASAEVPMEEALRQLYPRQEEDALSEAEIAEGEEAVRRRRSQRHEEG